jgi:hypothetical protein
MMRDFDVRAMKAEVKTCVLSILLCCVSALLLAVTSCVLGVGYVCRPALLVDG